MAKQVILAVAGAGKTHYICHKINPSKKNLILAYTHENIHNIQKELCDAHGCVPNLTTVMTFHYFVYHHLVLPYEPSIAEHFDTPTFKSRGICLIEPPPQRIPDRNGQIVPNCKYKSKEKLAHYVTKAGQYYCDNLSELTIQVKKGKESLIARAAARLNLFYDDVLIDEFQDFREHDYELIIKLAKQLNNVLLVGDYFQHSVSARNNTGKPFKNKKQDVSYSEFVSEISKVGFDVDTTTLSKSRRCSEKVCDYVSRKLGISITSTGDHEGSVIWADKNAAEILDDDRITKLTFRDAAHYSFNSINWSYSKGDTLDSVCVILTDNFDQLDDENYTPCGIPTSTINKLYVAMTRSRGDLYLIKASTFQEVKGSYIISDN